MLAEEPAIAIPDELDRTFRTYHGIVFRTAYRIRGNATDAEDVLQTVFLRLLRRGARRCARERRELLAPGTDQRSPRCFASATGGSHGGTPELQAELAHNDNSGLRRALGQALTQLKPRPAEVLAPRFLEGFSNAQIARMLSAFRRCWWWSSCTVNNAVRPRQRLRLH